MSMRSGAIFWSRLEFSYDGLEECVFYFCCLLCSGNVEPVLCSLIGQLVSLLKAYAHKNVPSRRTLVETVTLIGYNF